MHFLRSLKIFLLLLIIFPMVSRAAPATVETLLIRIYEFVVSFLVPLAFLASLVFFMYGLAKYIFAGADDSKVGGRQVMIWGTLGLFVASSIWGIINVLNVTLGVPTSDPNSTWYKHTCIPFIGSGSTNCADSL